MNNSELAKPPAFSRGGVNLLEGDVARTLWKLTGPMILAMFAMVAFTLVDTMYVGRLGKEELAAMSFTFPVIFFFVGMTLGIGIGAASIISRTIGAGESRKAARLSFDALILAILISIIVTSIGMMTIDPLFSALGAENDILPLIRDYMSIWYFGMPVVAIPMVGNNIIRATGDTKTPMKIMLASVMTNIVLDPLLIFGPGPFPELGLSGAALATVISRTIAMSLSLHVLVNKKKLVAWEGINLQEMLICWKQILKIKQN